MYTGAHREDHWSKLSYLFETFINVDEGDPASHSFSNSDVVKSLRSVCEG